jgi:uncharacterized protein involved in exopolysaccharide biosynthesis
VASVSELLEIQLEDQSLFGLFSVLWKGKWLLVGAMVVLGAAAAAVAFLSRPMYRAETVLLPVSDQESDSAMAALGGQLGAIGSLVTGNSLAGGNPGIEAVAVLTARDFIERFIEDENLLPVLFESKWDRASNTWVLKGDEKPPTLQDGYVYFSEQLYHVDRDRLTGLIGLSVDWYDTAAAVRWVEVIVQRLNARIRARDLFESEQMLNVLGDELVRADKVALRESINLLVERQMKRAMLARVRVDYALRTVDRPLPSDADRQVRPKRSLMIILGAFAGALLGVAIVLVRYQFELARRSHFAERSDS